MNKNKKITHGTVENTISIALYRVCMYVTVIAMVMVAVRFFSRGAFPPDNINVFYIGILALYSLHKEALHWILEKETWPDRRRGEQLVYGWFVLVASLYFVNFLSGDWFESTYDGGHSHTLKEATFLALEVGGIFVASRFIKIARMYIAGQLKEHKTVCIGLKLPREKKNARRRHA